MTRSKSGLATVIGVIFIILALAVGLNGFIYALNQQDRYTQVATQRTEADLERLGEDLDVTKVTIDSNKFNATLMNNGKLPLKVDSVWVTNKTSTTVWHQKFDFIPAKEIGPSRTITDVGKDLPLTALDSKSYVLKFVTERGNAVSIQSLSVAEADLKLSLFLMPRTISSGENVTIQLAVKNNQLDADSIHKINPIMNYSVCIPNCTGVTVTPILTPTQLDSLARDSTALFKWVYNIAGPNDTIVRFNATIQNAKPGSFVTDDLTIKPVIADTSSITSIIAANTGILSMDFTTFEFCKPSISASLLDCASNSTNWKPGWQVNILTQYIWRVNITNNGSKDIWLSENSAILLLHAQTGGGGNLPLVMYIKDDSTTTHEDPPGDYINYGKRLPAPVLTVSQTTPIYFGGAQLASALGDQTLQQLQAEDLGMSSVSIILFGYQDFDGDHNYIAGIDTIPYSQNIPFQGLYATL